MSTPFLLQFSHALVTALIAMDLLEINAGKEARTVQFLANFLHENGKGNSLLSTVEKALIRCDDVEEYYGDQETLKGIVETLKYGA